MQAVGHVNGEIARGARRPATPTTRPALDRRLIELDGTPNKTRLGANATLAVSMAAAHAAAASLGVPLYDYLGGADATLLPMPQIQIFGGGAHAGRRVDIQDFMVVCPGAQSFAQALEWTAEVYRHAGLLMQERGPLHGVADEGGWWPDFATNEQALETLVQAIERAGFVPGEQVAIALDIAASEFGRAGRYTLGLESRELDSDGMIELLLRWIDTLPDRLDRGPAGRGRRRRASRASPGRPATGCRSSATTSWCRDAALVREAARARRRQHGAAQAEPARHAHRDAATPGRRRARRGYAGIVSARSGETEDTTIVHLAVGWGAGQLKVGSFARGERMAKWNEALRIEERLGARARFAGATAFGRSRR